MARLDTVPAVALTLIALGLVSACGHAGTATLSTGSPPAPARGSAAATQGPPAATESAWIDQPVTFQAGPLTVHATYRHPVAPPAGLVPGVVLIPGNAFTDRNGNTPMFSGSIGEIKAVADWLSADGAASLRFDRVGSGQTGFGPYAGSRENIGIDITGIPFQPVEQEAAAALRFLASQRGVDPARLGVIGHSEGALYALLLAGGVDPKGSGSGPLPHVRALGLIEPFHGNWTGRYNPSKLIAGLPAGLPVLVTCSNADLQVTCAEVSQLRAWLATAGAALDFVPLTGVDHVLKQDSSRTFANYTKPLPFSPQLRQALRDFVKEKL